MGLRIQVAPRSLDRTCPKWLRPEHRVGSATTVNLPKGPFSGETSACNERCIRGLDRPLQLAWPDARHQPTSQWSLQHGARVVPRAPFAPSPALALWFATGRSATSPRLRKSVSLEDVACLRPPSRPLLHHPIQTPPPSPKSVQDCPPTAAQGLVDYCGVASLHSWTLGVRTTA